MGVENGERKRAALWVNLRRSIVTNGDFATRLFPEHHGCGFFCILKGCFLIFSFVWFCHSDVGHFIAFILDICTCFTTAFGNFVCFIRAAISAAISAPGAWLSCLSRLGARVVSLLDVL